MNGRTVGFLLGIAVAASAAAATVFAEAWPLSNRPHYITFSRAVALPGVELAAGTYIFELATPDTDQTVVRVSSRDRRHVYLQAFTYTVARPATLKKNEIVTFGEVRGAAAPLIAAWYPPDLESGRQFIYR
jgi:hypothetical protein